MTPVRMAIAAAALVGVAFFVYLMTSDTGQQPEQRLDPAAQEPVRTFAEEFYRCPPGGDADALAARSETLQGLVVEPLSDPDFFCEQMLGGEASTVTIRQIRTVFVEDTTAGVTADLSVATGEASEDISINVELAQIQGAWKISAVS